MRSGSFGAPLAAVSRIFDNAGNETAPVSATITLDTTLPSTPVIFNQDQATSQTNFFVTLSRQSTDANFLTYQIKGGSNVDWTEPIQTTTLEFTLTQNCFDVLSVRGKE